MGVTCGTKGEYDPRTVPCGTPESTFTFTDCSPSTTAFIFLCGKNIFNQLFIGPRIPYESIFESNFLCGTVSKALEKSKMATSVFSPVSFAFMKSWSVTNS